MYCRYINFSSCVVTVVFLSLTAKSTAVFISMSRPALGSLPPRHLRRLPGLSPRVCPYNKRTSDSSHDA